MREVYEPIESASTDELRALQMERLRWSLRHAYENVPHYRRSFDSAGVRPEDLRTLEDLARFPFTTKADLRDNYPFGMFAVPREQVVRIHASSGTTGKPTVVGYTQRDIDTWSTVVARSIFAAGGRPGDLVHVAYGYGLFTGGLAAHYQLEVTREGALDCLAVNVECEKQESASVHQRLASELSQAVKAYVGVTAAVNVHACGTIERSSGKAKRVVDRRRL